MTLGTTFSPFNAQFSKNRNAEEFSDECPETAKAFITNITLTFTWILLKQKKAFRSFRL